MRTTANGTTSEKVDFKRFPTVTYPIKADDLNTPQAYAYTLRRAIVTDCNDAQRAELVTLLNGKDTPDGVTFNNTQQNRYRLHIWQNQEARKQRAEILGNKWQWVEGLNSGTMAGDLITCTDGTQGTVTKCAPSSSLIEFVTKDGQLLNVGGYFRKERNYIGTEKSQTHAHADMEQADEICIIVRICFNHDGQRDPEEARQEAAERVISHLQGAYIYEPSDGLQIADIDNCGECE